MIESWKITYPCNRALAEALTDDHPDLNRLEPAPVLVASELDEDTDQWQIEAYFEGRPRPKAAELIAKLLRVRKVPRAEKLPDDDWVTLSQQGLEPVHAGRFYVHTSTDAPHDDPAMISFCIDAGQAFGTGHHATTAGCLRQIDRLRRIGRAYCSIIDVGTGTGLLAFAAMHLWPRAYTLASDIDPVSVRVTGENAAANGVPLGQQRGQLDLVVADGTGHPIIAASAPYDLIIANILAGPLITLAP
ncbi:MAG: 50S ribosomal protein L11 methyltransferase, partial [Sphingopyxis sp.]